MDWYIENSKVLWENIFQKYIQTAVLKETVEAKGWFILLA